MSAELLPSSPASVERAASILAGGGLVCFPTDTVYGLACRADSDAARTRFYAAKERPRHQPSIVMAADAEALTAWVEMAARARELATRFWPGPLTLVLPATAAATALGQVVRDGSLAVRVPAHDVALALLRATAAPLATSSANPSGGSPPTTGEGARDAIGDRVDAVLDGACPLGSASSILDLTRPEPRIVREGSIPSIRLLS